MKQISIALVGFGTVGRGLIKILAAKQAWLSQQKLQVGIHFLSTKRLGVCRAATPVLCEQLHQSTKNLTNEELPAQLRRLFPEKTTQEALVLNAGVNTVIELTPTQLKTEGFSYALIKKALQQKKNVITANKAPIALHLPELMQIAKISGAQLNFESTVLSGTPVFSLIKYAFHGDKILGIRGVLNGTCNFILSEMASGISYSNALATAIQLGYAETDPTADVEGLDSLAKLLILSEILFGKTLSYQTTQRVGISSLKKEDFLQAEKQGKKIKLIAQAKLVGTELEAFVRPMPISNSDALAHVNGSSNAIVFNCENLGEIKIEGPGAGSVATAVGIFNDLLQQVKC